MHLEGNEHLPIFLTLFGIVALVSDVHPKKAQLPIILTLFGIVIFVNDVHFQRAHLPISVT